VIVSVLAMFDISKARDESGNEIEINDEYSTMGMLTYVSLLFIFWNSGLCHYQSYRHKKAFKCSITPRSAASQKLVEDVAMKDHY
jgi:hypothetical protein